MAESVTSKRGDVLLVASNFPCGLSWLNNVLLELGLRVQYRSKDESPFWIEEEPEVFRLAPAFEEQIRYLPALSMEKRYTFRDDITVRWTHDWPTTKIPESRIVLFLRNPMDATFSFYKRSNPSCSYADFLRTPYGHWDSPESFQPGLPPADHWALLLHTWNTLYRDSTTTVVFEETKISPVAEVKKVLKHINVEREEWEILQAVERSSFEKAKKNEQQFLQEQQNLRRSFEKPVNRQGLPHEWKSRLEGTNDLECFQGLPTYYMQQVPEYSEIVDLLLESADTNTRQLEPKMETMYRSGLARACTEWAEMLSTEDSAFSSAEVVEALSESIQHFSCAPLLLALSGRALWNAGNRAQGEQLLIEAGRRANNFFELWAILDHLEAIGSSETDVVLMKTIAMAPTDADRGDLAWRLLRRGSHLNALKVTYSKGFFGLFSSFSYLGRKCAERVSIRFDSR